MHQADNALIMGSRNIAPGKDDNFTASRRAMLAGMMMAPAVMAAPALAQPQVDGEFWAAHARHKAIVDEWNSADGLDDIEQEDAITAYYSKLEWPALQAVVLAPVSTPRALLAKLAAVDAAVDMDTADDEYPDFWACLMRDVKGMAA